MMKRPSPSTIPRRQLGRQLRELRQGAGLSIEHAAQLIQRGATTVQRLEKGEAAVIRLEDIENFCQVYDAADQLDKLTALVEEANNGERDWWHQYQDGLRDEFGTYLGLESIATKITVFQSLLCPGLVQTQDYARVFLHMADFPREEIEAAIQVRMKRQKLITRPKAPTPVDIVVEETALRHVVGSPRIMAEQVRHLADLPANVVVRIIPIGARYPLWGPIGSFNLLDFRDDPSIVFIEQYDTDIYYERPRTVHRYRRAHDALKHVALSPADSKLLARQIAREHKA